jgi:hypothetical protein
MEVNIITHVSKASSPKLPHGVVLQTPPPSPLPHQLALVSRCSESLAGRTELVGDSMCAVSSNSDPLSLSMMLKDTILESNVNSFDDMTTNPNLNSIEDIIMDYNLNLFEDMTWNPSFESFEDSSK